MAPKPVPDPHANSTGWNIAAALGLLAAAFLMERLAPTETEGATKRETKRDASGAGPTEEGRGRLAEVAVRNAGKGMEDILFRVYSDVRDHRIFALAAKHAPTSDWRAVRELPGRKFSDSDARSKTGTDRSTPAPVPRCGNH